ncbi:TPA: hypothetical protein ACNP65_004909 [Escherichia coli]
MYQFARMYLSGTVAINPEKTAELKAAEMCETISMKGSPVKYVTTAEVRP